MVGVNLSLTEDDNNLTITAVDAYNKDDINTKIQTINTDITNKQTTLNHTTTVANSKTLLINNKIKNLIPGEKLLYINR
jgi:hypothetical protein